MDNFKIRDALIQDAPAIAKVHIDSWFSTYCRMLPIDFLKENSNQEKWEKIWTGILTAKDSKKIIKIAESDDKIKGYINCSKTFTEDLIDITEFEIHGLYLIKSAQRAGIGKALFKSALTDLAIMNVSSVGLWVFNDNEAVTFYRKLGGEELPLKSFVEINSVKFQRKFFIWKNIQPS
jgi:ribosomal protein S18 acetylase RimI-like enzyme